MTTVLELQKMPTTQQAPAALLSALSIDCVKPAY